MRACLLLSLTLALGCGGVVADTPPVPEAADDGPDDSPTDTATPDTLEAIDTATASDGGDTSPPTLERTEPPSFSPPPGTYLAGCGGSPPWITIASPTPDATVHFTADGTTPTLASPTFAAPIRPTSSTMFRALAIAPGFAPSEIVAGVYTLSVPASSVGPVVFTPPSGVYDSDQTVVLSSSTSSAVICYTLDGSVPNCNDETPGTPCLPGSSTYGAPLLVKPTVAGVRLRARACKFSICSSDVTSATYSRAK